MAKYIIDIPEKEMMYLNVWKCEEGKCVLTDTHTTSDLKPYTASESYIDGLKKGQNEAWKFARAVNDMGYDDFVSCFGGKTEEMVYELSYSEVKAAYEAWKRTKEEIRVGDEVIYNSRTRAVVLEPETYKKYGEIFTSEGSTIVVSHDDLEKTGRHFYEVEDLLKKMGDK